MNLKNRAILICFVVMIFSMFAPSIIEMCRAEKEEILFTTIDSGDQSGYYEEDYFVVRTEDEWVDVWKKHSAPQMISSCPEISFQNYMVICVFMGKQPTTGYDITIESIYKNDGEVYVEVCKWFPKEDMLVGQALTYPYILASIEKSDSEVIFNVSTDSGVNTEPIMPEYSAAALVASLTALLIVITIIQKYHS
jgi:hypothetical protein